MAATPKSGPSPLQAALRALAATKPGTPEFTAAYSTVKELRDTRPDAASGRERITPCAFGTCSRLFISEVGASSHGSGRKRLPDGTLNPDFCQGAADYRAAQALTKRTTW